MGSKGGRRFAIQIAVLVLIGIFAGLMISGALRIFE